MAGDSAGLGEPAEAMSTSFDTLVLEAVSGHTPDDPQDLVGILGFVDGREKLVLTREELACALERLIDAGQVGELPGHRFYERTGAEPPSSFSGLSTRDHDAACERYTREFWRKYREMSGE